MKLDSAKPTVFCANCGTQMQAEDAFVYYDLKTKGSADISGVESYKMLARFGTAFLEQKKHDLADSCFAKILAQAPDDYQVWRLRALTWESRVVNEFSKAFYAFDAKKAVLVENKEYLATYKEYCDNAVRYCPSELAAELAEEFNGHIRDHFSIAFRAYKKERRRNTLTAAAAVSTLLALAALALRACRAG
jgi:tetratricopeptide (TPR) repeat protein